jgi:cell fate regulator YaaT (PSP1 superfamily)
MVNIAGVRFKKAGKIYYFDPAGFPVQAGTSVIVETARGLEYGVVAEDVKEVSEKEIIPPLKKILRIADEKDTRQHEENLNRKEKSLALCQEKVDKHNLEMKLVDVEHTFDNSKIIFYFTSDGRVDFRDLVKDLAGVFKMRIELRQIGVRDEAKLIGGIGTCGIALCCHTWLQDFEPVSIKMAKVQGLSLNPTKISGICGRLMCCLKYENDVYCEMRRGMPDVGEHVNTIDGMGVVIESNILENRIKVRLVVEEKTAERQEKLASDYNGYTKHQIRRLGGKKNDLPADGEPDPFLDMGIKDLLED